MTRAAGIILANPGIPVFNPLLSSTCHARVTFLSSALPKIRQKTEVAIP